MALQNNLDTTIFIYHTLSFAYHPHVEQLSVKLKHILPDDELSIGTIADVMKVGSRDLRSVVKLS